METSTRVSSIQGSKAVTAGTCLLKISSLKVTGRPDGQRYIGEFVDGLRSGSGKCFFNDGSSYEGSWKDDKRQGEGVLTTQAGVKKGGQWENDEPVAQTAQTQGGFAMP